MTDLLDTQTATTEELEQEHREYKRNWRNLSDDELNYMDDIMDELKHRWSREDEK